MGYLLGVDLGTTWSAAAVARLSADEPSLIERIDMATLGVRTAEIPSVVALLDDDTVLVGAAAEQRATTEPERVAREFKRRIGDPTPLIIAGKPRSAESLMAAVLRHIVAKVTEAEGGPPDRIVLTHPANWGPYKLERFVQIFRLAGLPEGDLVPEPVAAARHYLSQQTRHVGDTIAVFDFGGGTFDAAVLRQSGATIELLGQAQGIEQLGGVDLDQSIFHLVIKSSGLIFNQLEETAGNRMALSRLRAECVTAKETLSEDTVATIPVMLPEHHTEVRLNRSEFEDMIRPAINDAISVIEATIADAGLEPEDIDAFLLVGGTSRIPLVSQMLSSRLKRPVLADTHPKHVVAKGAVQHDQPGHVLNAPPPDLSATPKTDGPPVPPPLLVPPSPSPPAEPDPAAQPLVVAAAADTASSAETTEVSSVAAGMKGRLAIGAVFAAIAVAALAFVLTRLGEDNQDSQEANAIAAAPSQTETSESGVTTSAPGVDDTVPPTEAIPDADTTTTAGPKPDSDASLAEWIGGDEVGEIGSPIGPHDGAFATAGPASLPTVAWETEAIERAGTAAGGNLAFAIAPSGDRAQQLVAHDVETGQLAWADEPFNTCCTNIVLTERTVSTVYNDKGPTLRVLDRTSGVLIEELAIGDLFADVPENSELNEFELTQGVVPHGFTIERGVALVLGSTVDSGTFLAAVELDTGQTRWSHYDPTTTVVPYLYVDETTAILTDEDSTTAIDLESGEVLWMTPDITRDRIEHLDAGILLTVDESYSSLSGLDVRTGQTVWSAEERLVSDLASNGTVLFHVSSSTGTLQARNIATGDLLWSVATSTTVDWGQVLIAADTVYIVGRNGVVSAHLQADGDVIWSGQVEGLGERDQAYNYVAIADGRFTVVEGDTLKVTTGGG